jgi:hypothetical protein
MKASSMLFSDSFSVLWSFTMKWVKDSTADPHGSSGDDNATVDELADFFPGKTNEKPEWQIRSLQPHGHLLGKKTNKQPSASVSSHLPKEEWGS